MTQQITVIKEKVYVQAFGQARCVACHRKTVGKLCDYVVGACGGYYTNLVPLCSRCHKRVKTKQK